jgi:predicted PurR-regulated permease PerM
LLILGDRSRPEAVNGVFLAAGGVTTVRLRRTGVLGAGDIRAWADTRGRMAASEPAPRTVLRIVLIVVAVVLTLYVIYLLRRPITWLVIATFLAVALAGPVNFLSRWMRRGFAIAITYAMVLLSPVLLGLLIVPPIVEEAVGLADNAPRYVADAREYVQDNPTLRRLEEDYNVLQRVQEQASELPARIGDAATALGDIGLGLVNSVFAAVTILVLSVFMVSSGRSWIRRLIALQAPDRAERLERTLERMAQAVGNYVAGALFQAFVCGITTFLVLTILGVPFAAPLAVLSALFDLIPLVGATIAAVVVGIVTLFSDFPTATIIWTIWAIIYQQIENTVIQPQIQKRAVNVHPFVVLVSVLFGSTLFGIGGALLAIPVAASIQIAVIEWWRFRRGQVIAPPSSSPPAAGGPEPGAAAAAPP